MYKVNEHNDFVEIVKYGWNLTSQLSHRFQNESLEFIIKIMYNVWRECKIKYWREWYGWQGKLLEGDGKSVQHYIV